MTTIYDGAKEKKYDYKKIDYFISILKNANALYKKKHGINYNYNNVLETSLERALKYNTNYLDMEADIDNDGEMFLKDKNNNIILYCHNGNIYSGENLIKNKSGNIENVKNNLSFEIEEIDYKNYRNSSINFANDTIEENFNIVNQKIDEYINFEKNKEKREKQIDNLQNHVLPKMSSIVGIRSMTDRLTKLLKENKKTKQNLQEEVINIIANENQNVFNKIYQTTTLTDKIALYDKEKEKLIELKKKTNLEFMQKLMDARISNNAKDRKFYNDILKTKTRALSDERTMWFDKLKKNFSNTHPNISTIVSNMTNSGDLLSFENARFRTNGAFNKAFWIEREDIVGYHNGQPKIEKKILLYISPEGKIYSGDKMQLETSLVFANKITGYDVIYDNGNNRLQQNETKTTHIKEIVDKKSIVKESHNVVKQEANQNLAKEIDDKSINSFKTNVSTQNSSQVLSNSQIEHMNTEIKQEFSQVQKELNNLLSDNQKIQNAFNDIIGNKNAEQKKKNKNSITREVKKYLEDRKRRKLLYKNRRLYFRKIKKIRKGKPEINLEDKNISLNNSFSK